MDGLLSGQNVQGELSIYQIEASAGDHRPNGVGRGNSRLMAKMCVWSPKPKAAPTSGSMVVRTLATSFLVARVSGQDRNAWWMHNDHVPRRIAEHNHRLSRLSQDYKSEQRRGKPRKKIQEHRDVVTRKHRNFISSFISEAVCNLSGYARRRRVSEVVYHDAERSYLPNFPWSLFWTMLGQKLAATNPSIALVAASERKAEQEATALESILEAMMAEEEKRV